MVILAGDVGGTKTHLALFEKNRREPLVSEKFPSKNYKNLEEIVAEFLSRHKQKIERACFGVAGPVQNGRCQTTNLPWLVEAKRLSELIAAPVTLINDLEANAYGIALLREDELVTIHAGQKMAGNAALLSAGTGLGEACLYWDGKKHIPFATEGGHASFAPENELEIELWHFFKKQFSHVSYERLLSGEGLVQIYRFLGGTADLSAKEITDLSGTCDICRRALDYFVEIYGSESGNLALKLLAVGGIYLGGGIAPKILPALCSGKFIQRMANKGRFAPYLSQIPVRVILNENTALLGAIEVARSA